MKRTVKTYFKFFIFLFGISLLLVNCEKDNLHEDVIESKNQEPTFTIKQYSRKNIEKNTRLVSRLKKFNDNLIKKNSPNALKRSTYNKEYDFTIYTDSATYIQNGDYHSYTFPIIQGSDEKITNVLFELNEENEYDAFLVNYDYSANELNSLDFSLLSMKTKMKPINLDFNSLALSRTRSAYVCIYTYEYVPTGDYNYQWNNETAQFENIKYYSWELKGSYCENVLYYDEDYKRYQEGNTATVTIGGTTYPGTGGGSTTSPMPSPFDSEELMKINVVKDRLKLNLPERLWIDEIQNGQYAFQLYDYGATNMWGVEAIEFGNLAVEAYMGDSIESLWLSNFSNTIFFAPPQTGVITDIDAYFNCFTNDPNSTYTVTIYVDQPIAGSREPYVDDNGVTKIYADKETVNVGHTFIGFNQKKNGLTVESKHTGLYPNSPVNLENPSGASAFYNDENHPYDVELTITVNSTQFFAMINDFKTIENYDINENNCTDQGLDCLKSGGINLPDTEGSWFMGVGGGSNPADLGEDIRNMNLTIEMDRYSNGGNAPSNKSNSGC